MPYVLPDHQDSTAVLSALGVFAQRARVEGSALSCRHHDFEFEITDSARPFDRLVAESTLG